MRSALAVHGSCNYPSPRDFKNVQVMSRNLFLLTLWPDILFGELENLLPLSILFMPDHTLKCFLEPNTLWRLEGAQKLPSAASWRSYSASMRDLPASDTQPVVAEEWFMDMCTYHPFCKNMFSFRHLGNQNALGHKSVISLLVWIFLISLCRQLHVPCLLLRFQIFSVGNFGAHQFLQLLGTATAASAVTAVSPNVKDIQPPLASRISVSYSLASFNHCESLRMCSSPCSRLAGLTQELGSQTSFSAARFSGAARYSGKSSMSVHGKLKIQQVTHTEVSRESGGRMPQGSLLCSFWNQLCFRICENVIRLGERSQAIYIWKESCINLQTANPKNTAAASLWRESYIAHLPPYLPSDCLVGSTTNIWTMRSFASLERWPAKGKHGKTHGELTTALWPNFGKKHDRFCTLQCHPTDFKMSKPGKVKLPCLILRKRFGTCQHQVAVPTLRQLPHPKRRSQSRSTFSSSKGKDPQRRA